MRIRFPAAPAALFCLLLLLSAGTVHAGSAWMQLRAMDPASSGWRDGLTVTFDVDEAQCRRAYGRAWAGECFSTPPGTRGMPVRGVRLTPATPGEWRWEDGFTMRFSPATDGGCLAPDTPDRLDVSGAAIPPRSRLAATAVDVRTQPQAARPGREQIWVDPSPAAAHGVSVPVSFIWPVTDTQAMEKRLRLASASDGLRLGETRWAWNADRDGVVVSARLLALSREPGRVALSLNGLPAYALQNGSRVVGRPGKEGASWSFGVPGLDNVFTLTEAELVKGRDERLNLRAELVLACSLRFDPQELARNLLVVELPEKAEHGALKNADWTQMPAFASDDLRRGRVLSPVLLSGAGAADRARFSLDLAPGRCVAVIISQDFRSLTDLPLDRKTRRVLRLADDWSEISFLQPGSVLGLGGSGKIALRTTGLDSLAWKVSRVRQPFMAMFAASHGFSTETLPGEWESAGALDAMTSVSTGTLPLSREAEGRASFPVLALSDLMAGAKGAPGLFSLHLTGFRDGRAVLQAERFILATSLSLTVKEEVDGARVVFVQRLSPGLAVAGARVTRQARNGETLAEADTNATGMAALPPAGGDGGPGEAVAVTARVPGRDGDISWISLKDRSRVLDNGGFAVQGRHGTSAGLMASVFSDRGLYMPGETLRFGVLVRRGNWTPLPPGLPLAAVIPAPAGRVVSRSPLEGDPALTDVEWKTAPDGAIGPWRLDIRLHDETGAGPVIGGCTVRVEEFEPDTLSLACAVEPATKHGWVRTGAGREEPAAHVELRTLYGEPAAGHAVRAVLQVRPARLSFPGYDGYTFFDPSTGAGEARQIALPQVTTDRDGKAVLPLPVSALGGTFSGTLRVEGHEAAGGRAVVRETRALFSPLPVVVGWRPTRAASTLDHLSQGSRAALHLLALDSSLSPMELTGVTATLSKRVMVDTLTRDERGLFHTTAVPVDEPVRSTSITIPKSGRELPLSTAQPGDWLLTLTGPGGRILLSLPFTVVGRDLRLADDAASLPSGNLNLRLARTDFEPGQDVVLRMSAPYAGTGLITIERDRVAASTWFRCGPGETEQSIRIPADFEGQGYVSVLFSRSSASDSIYLKPALHAAAPFTSGLRKRDMGLRLETPEAVAPGAALEVRVSAKRPGRALLFAVDEGILSLTAHATPDPLRDLLCGRALDVVTRQVFDLLMPDSERLAGRLPAFGGDAVMGGGRFLNPFRRRSEPPFARWIGAIDVGRDPVLVKIPVPSYFSGRVRVMAVGSADGDTLTAGSAEAGVPVRGTLLLRPMLPLAATPGDVFDGALVVANTIPGSGDTPVTVTIDPGDGFELVRGERSRTVTAAENGEVSVPFTLRARDVLGSRTVTFTAAPEGGDGAAVTRRQAVSLRPQAPLTTTVTGGRLTESTTVSADRTIYPLDADTRLTVAQAPLAAFRALASRLALYPFSCTEQRVSRAFPLLAALARPELEDMLLAEPDMPSDRRAVRDNRTLAAALAGLRAAIGTDGVALWPGGAADDFLTAYAGDFLMSLQESGRGAPADLLDRVLRPLERLAGREPNGADDARVKAYACWVLLRSGRIVTQDVERLVAWLQEYDPAWRSDVTASLLADCCAMLRLDRIAEEIMPLEVRPGPGAWLNAAAAGALHAFIISQPRWSEGEGAAERARAAAAAMDAAVERAFGPEADTLSMALTCRALTGAVTRVAERHPAVLRCLRQHGDTMVHGDRHVSLSINGLNILQAPGCRRFSVVMPSEGGPLHWYLRDTGYDAGSPAPWSGGMDVRRRYLDEQGREVTTVREGDVVSVEITLRSERRLNNVAVVDLLPGGLEPLLSQKPVLDPAVVRSERREDRWRFFTAAGPEPVVLTHRCRALVAGVFNIPAVTARAMYEPSIGARTAGGTLTVTPRQE